jgi:hypothetical protein
MLCDFVAKKQYYIFPISLFIFYAFFATPFSVLASNSSGTFDPNNLGYNKAYLVRNSGLNNISKEITVGKFTVQSAQNGAISDYELTGWMWGAATGWISFNCSNITGSCSSSNYKVTVDQYGNLSGYAWGPQAGWVNFAPTGAGDQTVKINSVGDFTGYAWAQSFGYISFNCSNDNSCGTIDFKTTTDYIPSSSRPVIINSGGGYVIIPVVNPEPVKNKIEVADNKISSTKTQKNSNSKIINKNSKKPVVSPPDKPILATFIPPEQPPKITKPKNINDVVDTSVNNNVSCFRKIINFIKSTSFSFYQFIKNLMQ